MQYMNKQKFRDLWYDDQIDLVESEADTSWRHGCYMSEVYKELDSETYWRVDYQLSGDGEWHSISELAFDIVQVEPYTETVVLTKYNVIEKETIKNEPVPKV